MCVCEFRHVGTNTDTYTKLIKNNKTHYIINNNNLCSGGDFENNKIYR